MNVVMIGWFLMIYLVMSRMSGKERQNRVVLCVVDYLMVIIVIASIK